MDAARRIQEMTDGQWHQLTFSPGYPDDEPEWSEVAAGNGTLVAVGLQNAQGAILCEQQGDQDVRELWLTKPRRVVWTGGSFLAPAGFQRLTLQSSDGIKWSWKGTGVCDTPPHIHEGPVAWFQGRLIALREDGRTGESADGLTWTWNAQAVDTERRRGTALVAGTTAILAFGPRDLILRSTDGLAWERLPGPGVYSAQAVASSSGVVVTNGNDTILRRDRDGSWCVAEELASRDNRWHLAGIESGGFLAVDYSGTIMVSLDGAECRWR